MADLPQIQSLTMPDKAIEDTQKHRRFKYVNFPFIFVIVLLVGYGLMVVYSAVQGDGDYNFSRQLSGVAIGVVAMLVLWRFDYRKLGGLYIPLIVIIAVLLVLPLMPIIGHEVNGGKSWVKIGESFTFQPGEFAKVLVILLAASFVSRYGGKIDDLREYIKCVGVLAIPFVCILLQPDLGTGLVYMFIAAVALLVAGAKPQYILATLAILVVAIVGMFTLDPILDERLGRDVFIKDYQKSRLLVFVDSSYDLTDSGYNLAQAKIAIGSGGIFGKGYMEGTQSSLGFLPEAPTDFIFCVLAEELGFFGALVLLALYASLVLVCFHIARTSSDLFGTVLVMCVVGMWLFQILENIGMTCGLMPITGIPLPFVSYAPSFMLVNFVVLGLVGSVWAHNGR